MFKLHKNNIKITCVHYGSVDISGKKLFQKILSQTANRASIKWFFLFFKNR